MAPPSFISLQRRRSTSDMDAEPRPPRFPAFQMPAWGLQGPLARGAAPLPAVRAAARALLLSQQPPEGGPAGPGTHKELKTPVGQGLGPCQLTSEDLQLMAEAFSSPPPAAPAPAPGPLQAAERPTYWGPYAASGFPCGPALQAAPLVRYGNACELPAACGGGGGATHPLRALRGSSQSESGVFYPPRTSLFGIDEELQQLLHQSVTGEGLDAPNPSPAMRIHPPGEWTGSVGDARAASGLFSPPYASHSLLP